MTQQPSQDQIIHSSATILSSTSNLIAHQDINEAKKSFKKSTSTNKVLALVLKCCMAINPFKPKMNLLGPKPEEFSKRKTLVLDIDETLVHTTLGKTQNSDIYLSFNEGLEDMGVLKRPFVDEFLEKVSEMFEVVIFTAGVAVYGKAVMGKLNKTGKVFKILSREHCTHMNGIYVKNLSRLGRDLKDVILVDNSANSFLLQPDNAYHIPSFFDDKSDRELEKLLPFLEYIAKVDDVRPVRGLFQKYQTGEICRENQLLKTDLNVEQTAEAIDTKVDNGQSDSVPAQKESKSEIQTAEPQSLHIVGKGTTKRPSVHNEFKGNFTQKEMSNDNKSGAIDVEGDILEDLEVPPKEMNPFIHNRKSKQKTLLPKSAYEEPVFENKKHKSLVKLDTERSALRERDAEEDMNIEVQDLDGQDEMFKYYPRGEANSPVPGMAGGIYQRVDETRSSTRVQVKAG